MLIVSLSQYRHDAIQNVLLQIRVKVDRAGELRRLLQNLTLEAGSQRSVNIRDGRTQSREQGCQFVRHSKWMAAGLLVQHRYKTQPNRFRRTTYMHDHREAILLPGNLPNAFHATIERW